MASAEWIIAWALIGLVIQAHADDGLEIEFFEKRVRPLLAEHCYECHSAQAEKLKANLYLDRRAGWETGGDSGPAIVPGKPDESLLIHAVTHSKGELKMPPKQKLPEEDVEILRKWIAMGAPDPREGDRLVEHSGIDLEKGREFWSFKRPVLHPVPEVKNEAWPAGEIDRFILARLETENLSPAKDASPNVLLRRLYCDLIGLPPTPTEMKAFLLDPSPAAIRGVVDDLMSRPEFGERWGRHWLDVSRFAESSGGGRSLVFPHAWRFRDYVIDAFNRDKPFDQFIREQIAGDLLPHDSDDRRNQQLVGSGYLVLGPINYELQDSELLEMEMVDEQIDAVGKTFLGMTLGCARCHDHKFDPIPATDYYALAGIFESTQSFGEGSAANGVTSVSTSELKTLATEESKGWKQEMAALGRQIASLKKPGSSSDGPLSIDPKRVPGIVVDNADARLEGRWTPSTSVGPWIGQGYVYHGGEEERLEVEFSTILPKAGRYEVLVSYTAHPNRASNTPVTISHANGETTVRIDQRSPASVEGCFVSVGTYTFLEGQAAQVTIANDGANGVVVADAVSFIDPKAPKRLKLPRQAPVKPQSDLEALTKRKKELEKMLEKKVAMAVKDSSAPSDTHLRIRGQVRNKGEIVPRGFISVAMDPGRTPAIPKGSSGRLELAEWIASAENPLTSRVLVNRVWMHLLGEGIVRTPDNFGQTGELPSHPELLDHLALRFTGEGWSVKKLIREIVLSRTYRMSSDLMHESDPENRLLGRANRKRLEAEAIRDTALLLSGNLDRERGGRTIRNAGKYDLDYRFKTDRRSVYVPWFRNSVMDLFAVFDTANPNLVIGKRSRSNLPTQALFLMNSSFIREQSAATAERLIAEGGRIEDAYRLILCRPPTEEELQTTRAFLGGFDQAEEKEAWTQLCQTLFSCVDFRFLD